MQLSEKILDEQARAASGLRESAGNATRRTAELEQESSDLRHQVGALQQELEEPA